MIEVIKVKGEFQKRVTTIKLKGAPICIGWSGTEFIPFKAVVTYWPTKVVVELVGRAASNGNRFPGTKKYMYRGPAGQYEGCPLWLREIVAEAEIY